MDTGPRYCVYDEEVSKRLSEIARVAYDDIVMGQRLFPGADFYGMVAMALHKAATVATNSACGDPLDKQWLDAPPEIARPPRP